MRSKLLPDCKSAKQARKLAPWAEAVVKVSGGYRVFENMADADIFKAQK